MSRRKVCVITGTRAEYGLLYWLMKEIDNDEELALQIVATGMHLSPEFGLTYQAIEADGFAISAKVEMLLSSDTPVGIAKSVGLGVIGFADAFAMLQPDIVVLLGDRYEIFAAAQAAMIARIPIAHIHGGELTLGAIDDAMRHAITKMAHLHFVAAEPYRRRVIQLGEAPERVFHVGALGVDNIKRMKLLSQDALEHSLELQFSTPTFLVTYHPETLSADTTEAVEQLLHALDHFQAANIIFTKANADTDGRIINQKIDDYVKDHPQRAKAYTSLGQLRYLSLLQFVDVVIGNSSSGLIEVPLFQKPTVNIGDRQKGRLKAASVIDCDTTTEAIISAIQHALSAQMQETLSNVQSLYDTGNVVENIVKTIKAVDLDQLHTKGFTDDVR